MLNDGDSDEKHTCCLQKVGRKTRKQLQYTVMIQGHKKSWNTEGCTDLKELIIGSVLYRESLKCISDIQVALSAGNCPNESYSP